MGPGKDTHRTLRPEKQDGWPVWIRQQIHGKHGSGLLRTSSQRDGTLGCRSGTRYHKRRTTLSRAECLGSTCSSHDEETNDECVGLHLKQGVFPKHDHNQQFV